MDLEILSECIDNILQEAQNSLEEAIKNKSPDDWKHWRGYRDGVSAVKQLLEDAQ